jgi:hypothetical protein
LPYLLPPVALSTLRPECIVARVQSLCYRMVLQSRLHERRPSGRPGMRMTKQPVFQENAPPLGALAQLRAHYVNQLAGGDPTERRLAARQLSRLTETPLPRRPEDGQWPASRWAHVPLDALLREAGNVVAVRRSGTATAGHEPCHPSKSNACLVVWPARGRWWCSSCRRGGDAVALVMSLRDWPYHRARIWLGERFGFPKGVEVRHG